METYENQNVGPLTPRYDQATGFQEWFPVTVDTKLSLASNYDPYSYHFGGASFDRNDTIPYPMVYGGQASYCNTHQQQQPEFGFYCPIPSPAPSISPTQQSESENYIGIEYITPTPFHSPPIEQTTTFPPSKTYPLEAAPFTIQNQHVPYSYHPIDDRLLQPVPENLTIDLMLPEQANPASASLDASKWHCAQCNKQFISQVGLKHHKNIIHMGERLFRCEKCGKRFAEPKQLQRHILRHVAKNKAHKCDDCPKTFYHRMDLRRHQYVHTGNAPHQCTICSKPFARRDHMLSHELTHRKQQQLRRKRKTVVPN